jgi:enoyl-CoA hydratase
VIERCFASGEPATSLAALQQAAEAGAAPAAAIHAAMLGKSPTSQAIAARQLALYAGFSFDEALRADFRIVSRICRGHDFYEGVRALMIDKDNRPAWRPGDLEAVSAGDIEAYFATLGADELEFGKAS